jgi:hypothetical protein
VHTFSCVLALMIAHLIRRTARQACTYPSGNYSPNSPASRKPCCSTLANAAAQSPQEITDRTDLQQQLYDLFELNRWSPIS